MERHIGDHNAAAERPLFAPKLSKPRDDPAGDLAGGQGLLNGNPEARELHRIRREAIIVQGHEVIEEAFNEGVRGGVLQALVCA